MACDLIVAADDAQFGEPEILYGSGPVTLLMPFILGQKKTKELLLTGDRITAEEALTSGLVNKVVARDDLAAAAHALARRIAPTPLPVLRLTKLALNRAYEAMGLRVAVDANIEISAMIQFGQLGDGNTTNHAFVPVPVSGGHTFTSLTAGGWHTCGLDGSGQAWCWGYEYDGQLGDGDATRLDKFVPVPFGLGQC